MFYRIKNDTLLDFSDTKYIDDCLYTDIITQEELLKDLNQVIVQDGEIVLNPNYEAEQAQKEKERIAHLTCTKRVFALMLQELGITYTMLKELIATNEQAQLEWDLCVELERKNPLLDVMAMQLGITPEQLDGLFMYANGELTIEEFRALYVKTEEELPTDEIVDSEEQTEVEDDSNISTDISE